MYTNEIFEHFEKINYNIAFSDYIRIFNESPQINRVTYNAQVNKYEMHFTDNTENLLFQIYNG